MDSLDYPQSILDLIQEFKKLPGVGARGADRLVLWCLHQGKEDLPSLIQSLHQVNNSIHYCTTCGFFQEEGQPCSCCETTDRDESLICVVEQSSDILPIENSRSYHGLYHCLGGKLSPLNDIGPEELRMDSLLDRIQNRPGIEVILALGSDVEGEATVHYISEQLRKLPCKITRLAQGLPAGAMLSYADSLTLNKAFSGRSIIHFTE